MENLPATKMRKKANFTDKETHVLLEEIGVEYTLLVSDLQNTVTVKKKREVWQNIAEKVNAVGCHNRDWEACKKRWKDLKAAYLRKPKYDSGTGGGKAAPPVPYEDMIKQIMGAGTNLTHGIKGGGDTYMAATADQPLTVVHDPDISGGGVHVRQLSSTLAEDSYVSVHDFTLPVGETVLTNTSGDGVKAEGMKGWTIAVIVLSIAGISIAVAVFIRKKAQTRASNDRVSNSDGDRVGEPFLQEQERSQHNEMIPPAHRFPQHDNFDRRRGPRQQNHVEGARDPCRQQNNVVNPEDPCSRQSDVEGPEGPCPQQINMEGTVDICPQQTNVDEPGAPSQENNGERQVDPCTRQYVDGLVDPRSQQTNVERPGGPCPQQTNVEEPEDISPQKIDVEGPIDSHSQKNKADGPGGCPQQDGIEGRGSPFQQNNDKGPADPCPHENDDEEPEYPCLQQNDNVQGSGDSFPQKFGEPDKLAAASGTEVDNTEADNSNTRSTRPHTESTDRSVSVKERVRDYEKRQ